ncbi:MAG: helix-turn-helix domain-containing protein [Bdellovibrionales bacterium]|nr:helix-turn-helix domain-containing protein [Bdellovibrionales bacterium]
MAVETPTTGMNGITRDLSRDLTREVPYKGLVTSAQGLSNQNLSNDRNMAAGINSPNLNSSDNLFVANLQAVSLEKLVKSKLEVLFQQQRDANIELSGLYDIVLEQVEKPLIELALQSRNGNQVKTAQLLGINRNTLKKKIDSYKIRIKRSSQRDQ